MKTSLALAAAGVIVLTPALAAATQPAQPANDQNAAPAKDPTAAAPNAAANAAKGAAQQDPACATAKPDKSKTDQSAASPPKFRDTGDTPAPAKKPKTDACATQPQ